MKMKNSIEINALKQLESCITNVQKPWAITLSFKFKDEALITNIELSFQHNMKFKFRSFATNELIQVLITTLSTDNTEELNTYLNSEDFGNIITTDEREDFFKQFLNSECKGIIRPDFITDNGNRYICVDFELAQRRIIKFCLPKNINIQMALRDANLPYDPEILTINNQKIKNELQINNK